MEDKKDKKYHKKGSLLQVVKYFRINKKFIKIRKGNYRIYPNLLIIAQDLSKKILYDVYGQEIITRVNFILLNMKLKVPRNSYVIWCKEYNKTVALSKSDIDTKNNKEIYGNKSIKLSDIWEKLDKDTKNNYEILAKAEALIFNTEMLFIKYFLFLGYDMQLQKFDGNNYNIYELFEKIKFYENYIRGKDFDMDIDTKIKYKWNNIVSDFQKNEYKRIVNKLKNLCDQAKNIKKLQYSKTIKVDLKELNLNENQLEIISSLNLSEDETKFFYKDFYNRKNDILFNIKHLINKKPFKHYIDLFQLLKRDVRQIFYKSRKISSKLIVDLLLKLPNNIKVSYYISYKLHKIKYFYYKYTKKQLNKTIKKKIVPNFESSIEKINLANELKIDNNIKEINIDNFDECFDKLSKEAKKDFERKLEKKRREHYKYYNNI